MQCACIQLQVSHKYLNNILHWCLTFSDSVVFCLTCSSVPSPTSLYGGTSREKVNNLRPVSLQLLWTTRKGSPKPSQAFYLLSTFTAKVFIAIPGSLYPSATSSLPPRKQGPSYTRSNAVQGEAPYFSTDRREIYPIFAWHLWHIVVWNLFVC